MATLKDSYIPAAEASSSISKQDQLCQTFTTTSQYRLDYTELLISKRISSSGGSCQVNIYATSGGEPTGSSLSSGFIAVSALSTSSAWVQISMLTKAVLNDATVYAIVINMAISPLQELKWYGLQTGTYADGTLFGSYDTGNTWSDTGQDFGFKIYGNDPKPAKAWTPTPADEAVSQPPEIAPTWADGDTYTDTFDVYFDKDTNPPTTKVINAQDVNIYTPGSFLDNEADYYWRVDSTNTYGTTTGDVWKFTTGAAIPISTVAELQAVVNNLSASYYLVNDINMNGESWTAIGNAGTPFTGIFDGQNFTISNLTLSNTSDYQGFFGVVLSGALIYDLHLDSISITADKYVGGFVGYLGGASIIRNCSVDGTVIGGAAGGSSKYVGGFAGYISSSGADVDECVASVATSSPDSTDYVGGFVGYAAGGTIDKSYATGDVSAPGTSTNVGGFVGRNSATAISNCYASGDITGSATGTTGGFVGRLNSGSITNSYSIGAVSTGSLIGGFAGYNPGGTVPGCYYDSTTSGQSDTGKGIPKITANMKKEATFEDWDFSTPIWHIIEDTTYPSLNVFPPGKPTEPSPTHEATGITLDESPLSWDASDPAANTYEIYFREQGEDWELVGVAQAGVSFALDFGILDYEKIYEWRVDATNEVATTTGDTWIFDSVVFAPVLPGASGGAGGGGGGGGSGEESSPTGENNMITLRRLVAAANSKIWYEDV